MGAVAAVETQIPTDVEIQNQEIERLKFEAQENSEEDRAFMEPAAPKKKRGRPKKERVQASQDAPSAAPGAEPALGVIEPQGPGPEVLKACEMTWSMASGALVKMYGDERMGFAPDELKGLSESWAFVVHKYAPDVLNKYGPEIMASATTVALVMRLRSTANLIESERREKMEAERAAAAKEVESHAATGAGI